MRLAEDSCLACNFTLQNHLFVSPHLQTALVWMATAFCDLLAMNFVWMGSYSRLLKSLSGPVDILTRLDNVFKLMHVKLNVVFLLKSYSKLLIGKTSNLFMNRQLIMILRWHNFIADFLLRQNNTQATRCKRKTTERWARMSHLSDSNAACIRRNTNRTIALDVQVL